MAKQVRHRTPFLRYFTQYWSLYVMSLPGLIYLIGYKFVPMIGLSLAFKDYNMFAGRGLLDSMLKSPYVGLAHFQRLFSSQQFLRLLENTLMISVLKIIFLFPLPILLALILNEMSSRWFKRGAQTILYLPHFLSWVIIYGMFSTLLARDGIVNQALISLGAQQPVQFFTNTGLFRPLLVFTEGWRETGWGTIVYLAALTGVDPQLHEAAVVDGASRFQRTWFITLPSIMPIMALMLLLRVGGILQAGTEQILVMYNPAVYRVGDVLQTYIYRIGLGKLDFSTGTALGIFESVVGFVLLVSCNQISRRRFGRSLW
jgi:putative aldouronate transport system permease protein